MKSLYTKTLALEEFSNRGIVSYSIFMLTHWLRANLSLLERSVFVTDVSYSPSFLIISEAENSGCLLALNCDKSDRDDENWLDELVDKVISDPLEIIDALSNYEGELYICLDLLHYYKPASTNILRVFEDNKYINAKIAGDKELSEQEKERLTNAVDVELEIAVLKHAFDSYLTSGDFVACGEIKKKLDKLSQKGLRDTDFLNHIQ